MLKVKSERGIVSLESKGTYGEFIADLGVICKAVTVLIQEGLEEEGCPKEIIEDILNDAFDDIRELVNETIKGEE